LFTWDNTKSVTKADKAVEGYDRGIQRHKRVCERERERVSE
jgi:hypothetical protein